MKLRLIRNATLRINYANKEFVIDPSLMPKYTIESFAGVSRNPLVDLPCPPEEVVEGIDMVIVSHLHPDHIDPLAQQLLPKDIQMFCQPSDENILRQGDFQSVSGIDTSVIWDGITIMRTAGQHGTGMMARQMGNVSGFLFKAENEPTVYWAGDTILFEGVIHTIREFKPEIVITHSGGARFPGSAPIIMDDEQTVGVCREASQAIVVATHLEALDHCTVSRAKLREFAEKGGITSDRLLIPEDGESITF